MKVIVLGCGPAGLMAAQGVADASGDGVQLAIASRKVKSPIYGCQYLHKPIPRVTPEGVRHVSYIVRGDSDDYRRKVYGVNWLGTVSPEDLTGEHPAWDLRATYDLLWERWGSVVIDGEVSPMSIKRLLEGDDQPDLIINSIPRPALCHAGHAFGATEVWAAGDAPELGIRLPYSCPPNMVICNGNDNPAWYRMSHVYGHITVEWPGEIASVPVQTASRVKKPLSHSCDCWADAPMIHVGRYGQWAKGVLSHTAYFEAFKKVEMMGVSSGASREG